MPSTKFHRAFSLICLSSQVYALVKVPFSTSLVPKLSKRSTNTDTEDCIDCSSAPTINAGLKAVVSVEAGDFQTFSNVEIDTGSALFWVGAGQKYIPGPHAYSLNQTFSEGYGDGYANGTVYADRVTIGNATVDSQIIGAAQYIEGFQLSMPFDGLLGLGPNGSNTNQISGYDTTPTFVQSLAAEGTIEDAIFGIYISPVAENGTRGVGEITFGGVDESRFIGEIDWVPQIEPYNLHWSFNASYFGWGNEYVIDSPIYAFTDTGGPLLEIPSDPYIWLLQNVPGITTDSTSLIQGGLIFPSNMTDTLPPLYIGVGSLNFTLSPSQYTVAKALYSELNITDDGQIHTWIATAGPDEYDLGWPFLQQAYSAYDMVNNRVGFAHLA
ncbi:uncharacterized protein FIBRA_03082 [Fibroporia radiculosa]|uniref:Peptidase A1 domain-containing protein n=1 Tax=Fibroporia radiculosa TaxID=599839 RepID=J4H275_9APHY|nr:uncharacterized protein FIBRA_03082 [Fibroporia radiculosa]CCM01034.1 predicted protein [Fibroporia radiculosa]